MNKKIICIPQYKHQEENINNIGSKKVVNLIKLESKTLKKIQKIFINFFNNMSQNKDVLLEQKKIASIYKIKKTLLLIEKFMLDRKIKPIFNFKGKTVIITGSSGQIGLSLIKLF